MSVWDLGTHQQERSGSRGLSYLIISICQYRTRIRFMLGGHLPAVPRWVGKFIKAQPS